MIMSQRICTYMRGIQKFFALWLQCSKSSCLTLDDVIDDTDVTFGSSSYEYRRDTCYWCVDVFIELQNILSAHCVRISVTVLRNMYVFSVNHCANCDKPYCLFVVGWCSCGNTHETWRRCAQTTVITATCRRTPEPLSYRLYWSLRMLGGPN